MRRTWALLALLALALPSCAHTDRPEGVVERWLISLNQGRADRPGQYAPDALSERILPQWATRDPGDLDVVEVGKGEPRLNPRQGPPSCGRSCTRCPFASSGWGAPR